MLVPSYSLIGDGNPLGTRNPNGDGYGMSFVPMMGMGMGMGMHQTSVADPEISQDPGRSDHKL
jgi:hypothetical protein